MSDPDRDWANMDFIPDGAAYPGRWAAAAERFRAAQGLKELGVPYGPGVRQAYDMFHPAGLAKGTVIFVHGGYWMRFGPRDFSHLAAGAVAAGYAVAMPGYDLAPDVSIPQITGQVAEAVAAIARRTVGPIWLAGHSAGGHLVARMACTDRVAPWTGRLAGVMPISPVAELAPLDQTKMNEVLRIDDAVAAAESPARLSRIDVPVHVWVGAGERPVFVEQAKMLGSAWGCAVTVEPGRHHFDVIEGLEAPGSPMLRALLGSA